MKFKEFVKKHKVNSFKCCTACQISMSTYWNCYRGLRKPRQRTAEAIEEYSKGLVTVKELRGTDDRDAW